MIEFYVALMVDIITSEYSILGIFSSSDLAYEAIREEIDRLPAEINPDTLEFKVEPFELDNVNTFKVDF